MINKSLQFKVCWLTAWVLVADVDQKHLPNKLKINLKILFQVMDGNVSSISISTKLKQYRMVPFSVTLNNLNQFQGTPLFNVECLRNDTIGLWTHGYHQPLVESDVA